MLPVTIIKTIIKKCTHLTLNTLVLLNKETQEREKNENVILFKTNPFLVIIKLYSHKE